MWGAFDTVYAEKLLAIRKKDRDTAGGGGGAASALEVEGIGKGYWVVGRGEQVVLEEEVAEGLRGGRCSCTSHLA